MLLLMLDCVCGFSVGLCTGNVEIYGEMCPDATWLVLIEALFNIMIWHNFTNKEDK